MKPFVILALNRCGTRMVSRSLADAFGEITHEFRGKEQDFWRHPFIHSNFLRPWMISDHISLMHVYRSDYVAASRSLLTMGYTFPPGSQQLPVKYVSALAEQRKVMDDEFRSVSKWSVSYESLCDGEEIDSLPDWFVGMFCDVAGLEPKEVPVEQRKDTGVLLANEGEIQCLSA